MRSKQFFNFLQKTGPKIKILSEHVLFPSTLFIQLHFSGGTFSFGTDKKQCLSYVWTKDTHAKGSNELSSALYHYLMNNIDFSDIEVLRLMADGCSCQNKNSTIISMISKWFSSHAPPSIKKV